jgi:hypothetical protein
VERIVDQGIQKRFEVKVLPQFNKLPLNTFSYADLVVSANITAKDSWNIIQWRSFRGVIGFDNLENIEDFDLLKINRISLYLHTFKDYV